MNIKIIFLGLVFLVPTFFTSSYAERAYITCAKDSDCHWLDCSKCRRIPVPVHGKGIRKRHVCVYNRAPGVACADPSALIGGKNEMK